MLLEEGLIHLCLQCVHGLQGHDLPLPGQVQLREEEGEDLLEQGVLRLPRRTREQLVQIEGVEEAHSRLQERGHSLRLHKLREKLHHDQVQVMHELLALDHRVGHDGLREEADVQEFFL